MSPLTPYMVWIKAGLAIALVLGIWFHGRGNGKEAGSREVAKLRADYAVRQAESTAYQNYLIQKARNQEQQWSEDLAMIAAKFEDDKQKVADETQASVLADIRAGRVRVRIPSCTGVPAPAKAAPGSSGGHESANLQREDALDLAIAKSIELAELADNDIQACQSVIRTYHKGPLQ